MRLDAKQPIGVFDSGLGGLTVVRALRRRLPSESILYVGDTARLPYGSKSPETVARYSTRSAQFLVERGVKMLLVACNTASAAALDVLERVVPVTVIGAIGPGADEAVAATRSGRVGVIGTLGTVRSGSYPRAIAARNPDVHVDQIATPLLVPLVEEGWLGEDEADARARHETQVAVGTVRRYLGELRDKAPDLDVIVLGCTHYPLIAPLLARVARELWEHPVRLVDSANAMALAADTALASDGNHALDGGALSCFLTDEARFREVGERFLGEPLDSVEKIDL